LEEPEDAAPQQQQLAALRRARRGQPEVSQQERVGQARPEEQAV
jgi:hypothetical protein